MVEKKSPVAAVKAGEKKTSVEAVKATVSAKKADEVKQAPKAAEKTEEKAAVKTAAVKKPAEKKAAEKKPAAKKTAVKKTAETKAEAQEPVSSVILQYAGREVQAEDWTRIPKMPPAIMKNPVRKEYIPIGFVRSSREMPTVSK